MVIDYSRYQSTLSAQQKLAVQLLQPLLARRRPARILVMKLAGAGDLPLDLVDAAQVIRLSTDDTCSDAGLRCRIKALPFAEAAFDLVILHHLIKDGSEAYLSEALRVLAAGGDIVISGLNSSGLHNRIFNRKYRVPALKPERICRLLKSRSFHVEQCLMMGFGGFSRPAAIPTWHGFGLPFADRVVLHGHHQSNIPNARILRFRHMTARGRVPAALDGCRSREAVS